MRRGLPISLVLAGWIAGGCVPDPEDGPADETATVEELVEACEDAAMCSADMCGDEDQAITEHSALEPEDIESQEWMDWDEELAALFEDLRGCYGECVTPYAYMDASACGNSCSAGCAASRGASGLDCASFETSCD